MKDLITLNICDTQSSRYPVSILRKSISDRHQPVRVADGPMTARCRFTYNTSWIRGGKGYFSINFLKISIEIEVEGVKTLNEILCFSIEIKFSRYCCQ